MLMVNWREDVEFIYFLSMLVSSIVVFFNFFETNSIEFAGEIVAVIVLIEALLGLIAFESNFAIARWDRLEKNQSA
jgi:hypothetical protein